MERKIFGIGWAKTGTTTLGVCLRRFGYNHQSQDGDGMLLYRDGRHGEIVSRARNHDSFEDWPWLLLYKELDRAYPGSRFILTTRATGKWLESYRGMLRREGPASDEKNTVRQALYGLPFPEVSDEALCARYERHNADVLFYFRGRSNLLVVDWSVDNGWKELCSFLGKDLPNEPFPHANAAPA